MGAKLVKYESKDGFRWRLVASNGKIIADSGEAYHSKSNLDRAVKTVRASITGAEIVEDY